MLGEHRVDCGQEEKLLCRCGMLLDWLMESEVTGKYF